MMRRTTAKATTPMSIRGHIFLFPPGAVPKLDGSGESLLMEFPPSSLNIATSPSKAIETPDFLIFVHPGLVNILHEKAC